MPGALTYPGVYIEEISSGVHTISGVATSITAFVGYTARGLDNLATEIFSFADFERSFGGLAADSELSYSVQQFYQNGGTAAFVVRIPRSGSTAANVTLLDVGSKQALKLEARSNGTWSDNLIVDVDYAGVPSTDAKAFNLTITDLDTSTVETFPNVSLDSAKTNFVIAIVNDEDSGSALVKVSVPDSTAGRPVECGISGGTLAFDTTTGELLNVDKTKDNVIKIVSDLPSVSVEFSFLAKGEAVPSSVLSVCQLFERKATAALQSKQKGASVRCVPGSDGKGIRVTALIPNALDAQVTFAAGTADLTHADADTALKLTSGNAASNVSHYWPNSQRGADAFSQKSATRGTNGSALPGTADLIGNPGSFTGIYALDKVDLFNILCLPDATRALASDPTKLDSNVDPNAVFGEAMTYCKLRRAFLLIDPPPTVRNVSTAVDWKSTGLTVHDKNGAAYFPRLKLGDPLNSFQLRTFAPCGVIAGLYSRTDATRGVWKAPAGTEATLSGVQGVVYKLTDDENGVLNPLGLNCLRIFPVYGPISWGARTLVGSDADASEWKYVPVRRLALFLEESLFRGTKWIVFEPNDEPLWAQIRLNLGAFMQTLFRQGAFQGSTAREAYFVKCDKETTTQNDIDLGIVNILVGFAPLKPAEFVVIKLQQIAGQIAV